MRDRSPMSVYLWDMARRLLLTAAGLLLFAFGVYTQLAAGIGTEPWNTLSDGLSRVTGVSFGTASIIISIAVVIGDILLREPIGTAMVLDALLMGWWTDMFIWLDPIPTPETLSGKLLVLIPGIAVTSFGQCFYMKAGLGCGPRDALMVAVGKRFPKVPIGVVNIAIMSLALLGGWLMGGVTGIGTLITMFCTGFCMDLVFHLLHFEPRAVQQEGFAQTWAAFQAARTHK